MSVVSALPTSASAESGRVARRDLRLDLLRGFCVLLMIFGHLAFRRLEVHFHLGFVGIAEGFFFLSGATLGLVARRRERAGRSAEFDRRIVRRAVWLWGAHLITVAGARLLEGTRPFPGDYFTRYWGQAPEIERWLSLDQPSVLNVLPRYVVFLLAAPLALWLLRRSRAGTLAAISGGLWLAQWWSAGALRLPLLEGARAPYPVASWQLIFFSGLIFGWWVSGQDPTRSRHPFAAGWLILAAAILAALIALEAGWWQFLAPETLARWTGRQLFGPLRLLNFAVAVSLFWEAASRWGAAIGRRVGFLIVPFGQWALPAFLLHIPLVWILLALPAIDRVAVGRPVAALAAIFALLPLLHAPLVQRWLRP